MSLPGLQVLSGGEDARPGLPESAEAEEAVLAGVLLDETPTAWSIVQQCGVRPAAFYRGSYRTMFEVVGELFKRGEPSVHVSMLAQELKTRGQFEEVGGMEAVLAVSRALPTTARLRYFAEQVKLLWDMRHTWALGQALQAKATAFEGDRDAWVAEVASIGSRLITLGRRDHVKLVADHASEVSEAVRARETGQIDRTRWVDSSLALFNKVCKPYNSGIQDDGLVLVGGGSGTGKSVWLRQEAYAALRAGKMVLFISRETSTRGVMAMMAAAAVGVDLNNIEREPADRLVPFYDELERMKTEWADKLLFVVQNEPATPLGNIEDVVELVRAHVHRRGTPHLVTVDYLQLFETRKKTQSREQTVAVVSHALQALRTELGCVVMVAAQLNETGLAEMRTLKRDESGKVVHRLPKPGDLRESQAMYHDADRVVFLYKPPVDCRDVDQSASSAPRPEVWIYQEKRRSGGVSSVRTWFEKRYTRFVELTKGELIEAEQASSAPSAASPARAGGGSGAPMSKADWKMSRGGRA